MTQVQEEPKKLRLRRDPPVGTPEPIAATSEAESSCPDCQAPMEAEAILCIKCGYDSRTKTKLGRTIQEEPAAWRRYFVWNPPAMTFKTMIVNPIILVLFFFGSIYYTSHSIQKNLNTAELMKSGLATTGRYIDAVEVTMKKSGSKTYTMHYSYSVNGNPYIGNRGLELFDLEQFASRLVPINILYKKDEPHIHVIKNLPPESSSGMYVGLIFLLLTTLSMWSEYFLPARGHRT